MKASFPYRGGLERASPAKWFQDPEPRLLASVSRLKPEQGGLHVLLEPRGIVTTQRLAISGYGGGYVAALWPGELKEQALALYGNQLGTKVVPAALERGWSPDGTPHLAFRSSPARQRLYMKPEVDAREYARRWEQGDLEEVGLRSSPITAGRLGRPRSADRGCVPR